MIDRTKNLVARLLPWYHEDEEQQRDDESERVHERAERAIDSATLLIRSYQEADRILARDRGRRLWRSNGV